MLPLSSSPLLKGGTPDIQSAARQVLTDWNHQKLPYLSVPPTIHPSSIPSMIPTASEPSSEQITAPGAERIGQAQSLLGFSKPFELEGLVGAVEAGAFGSSNGMDVSMGGEGGEGNEGRDEMFGVALIMTMICIPLGKRARSPLVFGSLKLITILDTNPSQAHETVQHQPKRRRKFEPIPDWDALPDAVMLQGMGKSNPLNRHVSKDRKRERKLIRNRDKLVLQVCG